MFKFNSTAARNIEETAATVSLARWGNGATVWFVMDYIDSSRNSVTVAPHDVRRFLDMGFAIRCAYCNGHRLDDFYDYAIYLINE